MPLWEKIGLSISALGSVVLTLYIVGYSFYQVDWFNEFPPVTAEMESNAKEKVIELTGWSWVNSMKLVSYIQSPRNDYSNFLFEVTHTPVPPEGARFYETIVPSSIVEDMIKHNINIEEIDESKNIWSIEVLSQAQQWTFDFVFKKSAGGYLRVSVLDLPDYMQSPASSHGGQQ